MSFRVGIATSDALIGGAIYREVVKRTPEVISEIAPPFTPPSHIDTAVYASQLGDPYKMGDAGPLFHVLERTSVMRNMEIDVVIMPDIDMAKLRESVGEKHIQSQVSVFVPPPDLQIITKEMVNGIQENIATNTEPSNNVDKERFKNVMELFEKWADFLVHKALRNKDELGESIPVNNKKPHSVILKKATADDRHKNGMVGLHGGMNAESSADPVLYTATTYPDTAILLMSAVTTPDPSRKVYEKDHNTISSMVIEKDPLPRMLKTRELLNKNEPDSNLMICNTAHYWNDSLVDKSDNKTIHLIEEGIKNVPKDATVLLLATYATIKTNLHKDDIERLGRSDITLLIPDEKQQQMVDTALFNEIMTGKVEEGGKILKKVIDAHEKITENLIVLGGCTEVEIGLNKVDMNGGSFINPVHLACDKAAELAKKNAKERSLRNAFSLI